MKIFVVGSGKLAHAILASGLSFPSCEIVSWEPRFQYFGEKSIIVHAGSGRQLKECFELCNRTKSVLIELSTGLETSRMQTSFPLIVCPNTSILVLKTLNMLKASGSYFENYGISVTESHQSAKKSEPGTAYAFAASLNFPVDKIVSVRDKETQHSLGIPAEFLEKHAYHKIVIEDGIDQVTIETKVLGHHAYARGVKAIVEAVLTHDLENRNYTVFELIDKNIL